MCNSTAKTNLVLSKQREPLKRKNVLCVCRRTLNCWRIITERDNQWKIIHFAKFTEKQRKWNNLKSTLRTSRYQLWKRQKGQGCPNNKDIMTMENQSGLKPLTFQRGYLLSETTEMVWKINGLFLNSGLSFPIFICTARASETMWPLLQICCDKMLIQARGEGIFLLEGGVVGAPHAAYEFSRTSKINGRKKKGEKIYCF